MPVRRTNYANKAIEMNWEYITTQFDTDEDTYCLTNQQVAIVLGLLEYMKWPTRWIDLGLSRAELTRYIGDLENRLMEHCPVDCTEVLDCIDSAILINDPLPPVDLEIDADRCKASVYIVDKLIAEVIAAQEANTSSTLPDWLEFLLSNGGYIIDTLVLLWDVVALLGTPEDVAADLATDRDELIAAVYCSLLDRQSIINTINDSETLTDTTKDAVVAVLQAVSQAKILLWSSIGVATQEVDEACDCVEEPVCPTFDFTISDGEWLIDTSTFNHPGLYVASTGWEGDLSPLGGSGQNTVIHIKKTFEPFFCTSIKMIYSLTKGQFSAPTSDTAINVQAYSGGVLVHTNNPLSYAAAVNGTGLERVQAVGAEIDEIKLLVRAARFVAPPSPAGYALITGCEVTC